MDFHNDKFLIMAYIISNVVGVLFLWVAFKWPKVARLLFVLLFGWASWFNYTTCHQQPEIYLSYGETSLPFYTDFINGWFKEHITLLVSLIAVGQGLIALGMLGKGNWVNIACFGVMLFLVGIAPLGVNSAFPFSITVSVAAYFIIKKDDKDYLWKFKKAPHHLSKTS